MSKNRGILIVEDEPAISNLLALHVRENGWEPRIVERGQEALELLEKTLPAAVVLDLMLPDMDGIEVLRRIRQNPHTKLLPVLILTARGEEADRVLGLEVGADDYLAKPFSPRELILRLQKLIEGRGADAKPPVIQFGVLEVDEGRFRVTVEGTPIEISATEMRLLVELLQNRGKVLSRQQLLQKAWGFMPNVTPRTIDTHVKRLRQKLGVASAYIETVRGVGYRFVEQPPAAPPAAPHKKGAPGPQKTSERTTGTSSKTKQR